MNSRMISLVWMENWLLACEPNPSELPLEYGRCRLSHQSPGIWEELEQAEFEVLGVFSFEKLKRWHFQTFWFPLLGHSLG